MKYAAKVEYLGLNFAGFQRQKNHRSVQGELESSLSSLLGENTLIHGAGRTDAGVSALGQVISFVTDKTIKDLESFRFHWNCILPDDVSVVAFACVGDDFDARHSCCGKKYRYRFIIGDKHPLQSNTAAYLGMRTFDAKLFITAIRLFEGKHCFHNFTTKKDDKDGFVRTIEPVVVTCNSETFEVVLSSNGFMTYQIRFMVGAALKVGFGKMDLDEVRRKLDDPVRKILPYKAPPEGLVLEEVKYGFEVFA